MTQLAIVVVSFNTRDKTARCIDHLLEYTDLPFHIVVVDNASRDGTRDMLRDYADRFAKDVTVVLNERNVGYAPAVEQGCSHGVATADVCLVNPDLYVGPEWASRLHAHLRREPLAAVVAPLGRGIGGRQDFLLHHPAWCEAAFSRDGLEAVNRRLTGCRPCAVTAKSLQGPMWMMRAEARRQLGGLDPACTTGADDADWCLRARLGGWKLLIALDVFVWHEDHSSFSQLPERGLPSIARSWDYLNQKWKGMFDHLTWEDLMETTVATDLPPFVYEEFCDDC